MKSIKEMSIELSVKFSKQLSKIAFTIGMLAISFILMNLVLGFIPAPVAVIFPPFLFFVFFELCYGAMVLITRLERNVFSSLGYLFIGFKHKRTIKTAWFFTLMIFVCLSASSVPLINQLFSNIDFTSQEMAQKSFTDFFSNTEALTQLAFFTGLIFMGCFVLLFLPFSFVWIIVYDNPELGMFKAFGKSAKMFIKNIFKFLGLVFYSCRNFIFVLIAVELLNVIPQYVLKMNVPEFSKSIYGFINFLCGLSLISKISYIIPYFYDQLCEKPLSSSESESSEVMEK